MSSLVKEQLKHTLNKSKIENFGRHYKGKADFNNRKKSENDRCSKSKITNKITSPAIIGVPLFAPPPGKNLLIVF